MTAGRQEAVEAMALMSKEVWWQHTPTAAMDMKEEQATAAVALVGLTEAATLSSKEVLAVMVLGRQQEQVLPAFSQEWDPMEAMYLLGRVQGTALVQVKFFSL